jgi:hypothetical protein
MGASQAEGREFEPRRPLSRFAYQLAGFDLVAFVACRAGNGRGQRSDHSAADPAGRQLAAAREVVQRAARDAEQSARLAGAEHIGAAERLRCHPQAARFLDAIEHPGRFEAGLRRLVARPPVLPCVIETELLVDFRDGAGFGDRFRPTLWGAGSCCARARSNDVM